jgi:ADP-ribose pyrophosphatase YjhB (NUDIX family)
MRDLPPIRNHVSVVVADGARVLFVREDKPETRGLWNLPGGHLEFGEPIECGARRELREETGLELELEALLGIYTGFSRRSALHSIRYVFVARYLGGEPRAGHEIQSVGWWTRDDLEPLGRDVLLAPALLKRVMADFAGGVRRPLETITHLPTWV